MSWFYRRGTDPDGFPEVRDDMGRTPDEAEAEMQATMMQSYRLANRSLLESAPYLGIRQIGVDADGFPVFGRPF